MSYVEFKRGLKSDYILLSEKSQNIFYFCEDTGELFLGNKLINLPTSGKINETKVVKAWTEPTLTGRCYYVVTDIDNNWVKYGDIVYYDEDLEYAFAAAKLPLQNQFMVSTITLYYDMSVDYDNTTKTRYVAKDDVLVTEKSVVEFVHNNHTQIGGGDGTYLTISSSDDINRNNYNINLLNIDKDGKVDADARIATIKSIKNYLENNNYYNKENLTADELLRIQGLNFKQGDVVCYNIETGNPYNVDTLGMNFIVFPWEEFVDEYEKKGYANIDEKYKYPVGLVLDPQRRTFVYSQLYTPGMVPYGGTGNVLHFARTSVSNGLDTKYAVEAFWNTPQQSGNKSMNFPAFYDLSIQDAGAQMTEGTPPQNLFYLQHSYNYIPSIIELEDCFDNNLTIPHPDTPYFIPSSNRPLSRMEYMLGLKNGLVLEEQTDSDDFPVFIPEYNIFNGVSSTLASNVGKLNVGNRTTSIDCYDIRTDQFYLIIGLY